MKNMKKTGSRVLGALLSMAMILTMLPTIMVSANEGVDVKANDDSPIQLSKTATLQSDGTYTIDLEAYVTGEIVTQIEKKNKPTDIVLVLDQSGSMAEAMSGLPGDSYSSVGEITNAQAYEGAYYYKVEDNYFPVTVKYASTSSVEKYVDDAGNVYDESQVATTWTNYYGKVIEANGPYLASSLIPVYRYKGLVGVIYWYLRHDAKFILGTPSSGKEAEATDQTSLRNELRNKYQGQTVQFENDDYTAAIYTQLTPIYSHTYEYYYTDAEGNMIQLPAVGSSNNTECPYELYVQSDASGRRLDVLQYAAKKFVDGVAADARTNNIEHRIAVVGFGSNDGGYDNTEILTGVALSTERAPASNNNSNVYFPDGYAHNGVAYNGNGYDAAQNTALQSITTQKDNIDAAISALTAYGATETHYGMQMAQDILSARSAEDKERDAIVVFFTDGEPSTEGKFAWQDTFENDTAAETVNIAKELKIGEEVTPAEGGDGESGGVPTGVKLGYTASVYSVAVYDGASPTGSANINGKDATRINDFLHMVSSNYPNARGENQDGRGWEFFRERGANNGYYMVANNAATLANAFSTVTNNIHETITTVNLDSDSVLKDILSRTFTFAEGYDINNVLVKTADYLGNGKWADAVPYTAQINKSDDKTIEVKGFDYSSHIVAEASDGQAAEGAKLIVSIPGVTATAGAAVGAPVFTNTADSGIYDTVDGEEVLIKEFYRPTVTITNKSYVLDYGKEAVFSTSDLGLSSATHINSDMSRIASNNTSVDQKYGKSVLAENTITYTPQTMNWDGYDSVYAFGTDSESENQWARMNVLPANSVYYEDTFVTDSSDGTVGIVYSEGNWSETGNAENSGQTVNDSVYGWEDCYSDDETFSDGSAHTSSTNGATATFTFTGTGVDVYSKTDMSTGIIMATVYEGTSTDDSLAIRKILNVDGKAETGDEDGYYQVPTLSLSVNDDDGNPIYGTYTVKLKVRSTSDGRSTYYLDGIRVYNPIQDMEGNDANVDQAYGDAGEANAVFQKVRDILLDSDSFTAGLDSVNGSVFIDKSADGIVGDSTDLIGEYKDYGAKNEVYLAKGQGIAFEVDPSLTYYLGLRVPDGENKETTVSVTNGDNQIEHTVQSASDLYYKIVPKTLVTADGETGYIFIKNNGENMLAVTKLRMTGSEEISMQDLFRVADMQALMSYVESFDELPVVDSSDSEDTVVTVPDDESDTAGDSQTGDVVIENPDDGEQNNESQNNAQNTIRNLIDRIFSGIRSWFM